MTTQPIVRGAWRRRMWARMTDGLMRVSASTILLLAAVFIVVLALLTYLVLHVPPWGIPADKDSRAIFVDLVKVSLAVAGGMGAAVALVVAYRRQKHLEADGAGKRSRYAGAAQQLGDPQAAVRMAGAYAMAHLADEWPQQRQQCVDVLCAYLRLPWVVDDPDLVEPTSQTRQRVDPVKADGGQTTETLVYSRRPGEREVRRTLTRIITDHLRDASTVSWDELRLDLTGATLVDADFTGARIGPGSTMTYAHFVGPASFRQATFSGDAMFDKATFSGTAMFAGATFSAPASLARFDGATFFGDAKFDMATFSRAAVFEGATFSGDAKLRWARFSRAAVFDGATFSRAAVFDGATFSGDAKFDGATFSDESAWKGARLPSRKVFDACQRPPTREALDEAIFQDEQPRPTDD